jgi:3-oxoacyl-[acyl-carrier protein] reductase
MNIIITGASRGVGYELVKQFSLEKDHTIFAIARNSQKLEQLKSECLSKNSQAKVIPLVCDLNDADAIVALLPEIKKHVASIHILINNAGAIINKPFGKITRADLEQVYSTNVFSVITLIQQLLPFMDQTKRSHIINISSMGGFQGSMKFAGLSAYSSSKAALACITECLAEEFKDSNVSFNCLALGAVQTEMLEEAFPGYKAPLSAGEMAGFISDFALNGHNYLNGKILPVSLTTP